MTYTNFLWLRCTELFSTLWNVEFRMRSQIVSLHLNTLPSVRL